MKVSPQRAAHSSRVRTLLKVKRIPDWTPFLMRRAAVNGDMPSVMRKAPSRFSTLAFISRNMVATRSANLASTLALILSVICSTELPLRTLTRPSAGAPIIM